MQISEQPFWEIESAIVYSKIQDYRKSFSSYYSFPLIYEDTNKLVRKLLTLSECESIMLFIAKFQSWQNLKDFLNNNLNEQTTKENVIDPIFIINISFLENVQLKRETLIFLAHFRQWYIDSLLLSIDKDLHNVLVFDCGNGSRDPESDYDITIGTKDQSNSDIEALKKFNSHFQEIWNIPSSILLDTNLYLKDYFPIQYRLNEIQCSPFQDMNIPVPLHYFRQDYCVNQLKYSFLKLKTSIKNDEQWDQFFQEIRQKLQTEELKQNILNLKKSVDDLYNKCDFKIQNALFANFESQATDLESNLTITENTYFWFKNQINIEIAQKLRQQYNRYYLMKRNFKTRDLIPKSIQIKLDNLSLEMSESAAMIKFFSNEVYVSQGAIKFIGLEQKVNVADKFIQSNINLRFNNLDNFEILCYINENLGFFIETLNHYKSLGRDQEGFYRSSKYLQRIFLGASELTSNKILRLNIISFLNNEQPDFYLDKISQSLLKIRKASSGQWIYASYQEKCQEAQKQIEELFQLTSTKSLISLIFKYVAELNSQAILKNKSIQSTYHENIPYILKLQKDPPQQVKISISQSNQYTKWINQKQQQEEIFEKDVQIRFPIINGTFFTLMKTVFALFILALIRSLCYPLYIFYMFSRSNVKNSKPQDRLYLDLRCALETINSKSNNIHYVLSGEIENTYTSISQVYLTNNLLSIVIAYLRYVSEFSLTLIPWISWMIIISALNFNQTFSQLVKLALAVNLIVKFVIDFVLYALLIILSQIFKKRRIPETDNSHQCLRRELQIYRANTIANILGLFYCLIITFQAQITRYISNYGIQQQNSFVYQQFPDYSQWLKQMLISALGVMIIEQTAIRLKQRKIFPNQNSKKNDKNNLKIELIGIKNDKNSPTLKSLQHPLIYC